MQVVGLVLADGRTVTVVHFFTNEKYVVREDQTMMRDTWREVPHFIACMPNMREFGQTEYHPAYHRSNEPRAVTCPECMKTHEYARAMEKQGAHKPA